MGKYALLIGIGEYGMGLQPLPAAPNDVSALRAVLENPEMGGFDEVKLLINRIHADLAREIELWFQGRQRDDLILLFFSGHGIKDERRDLYFGAQNTEKRRDRLVRSTALSARFVNDCVRSCKAKHQVIILDCCFSGAFGDMIARDDRQVNIQEQLGAEGRVVLTSTSAVDYSFEEKGGELSIYTRYIVEGIASGAADENGDGVITVENLHRYASRKVEEASPAMSPKIITLKDEGYRIPLAKSPQNDPRLIYRKEVERRVEAGRFSGAARHLLNRLCLELGISEADAKDIEAEVIKPHQEYQRKQQEYRDTLRECLQDEGRLSAPTIRDLIDFRAHLRLKPEDVASIERVELSGYDLAEYTTSIERDHERPVQSTVNLNLHARELTDWQESGREDKSSLLSGQELETAIERLAREQIELDNVEREFIIESIVWDTQSSPKEAILQSWEGYENLLKPPFEKLMRLQSFSQRGEPFFPLHKKLLEDAITWAKGNDLEDSERNFLIDSMMHEMSDSQLALEEEREFVVKYIKGNWSKLEGKAENPYKTFREIISWTECQTFLTQKLCEILFGQEPKILTDEESSRIQSMVEKYCGKNPENQDISKHFQDLNRSIVDNNDHDSFWLLFSYRKVLQEQDIEEVFEEMDTGLDCLCDSGLIILKNGKFQVRNPIYASVFDEGWVNGNIRFARPYAQKFMVWLDSHGQDDAQLLSGEEIQEAIAWAQINSGKLTAQEDRFLAYSQL